MSKKWKSIFNVGYRRNLTKVHLQWFAILAVFLSIYQIWCIFWGTLDPMHQMALFLSIVLALTFLLYGYSNEVKNTPTKVDYFFSFLAIGAGIYFSEHAARYAVRIPVLEPLTPLDIFFGMVFVLLSVEAVRRTIGFPIVAIAIIGFIYALYGHYLSGWLGHRRFSFAELLDELAFSYNGLWSSPISVAASFVFMFLLFGAFLKKAGAGEFFYQLSASIAGRTRGGTAKVAVLSSAFFGSISGSPTANVVTTGSFTIPASKRAGYKSTTAAAIEAAASTGGSILPPIMGSSAFLMAAVTQIPYSRIMIAAIIPGVLYYLSLLLMVHFEALRSDLRRPKKEDIPRFSEVIKGGWYYFIPFFVLIGFLLKGYSPSRTAFYSILTIIVISWFTKNARIGLKATFEALVDGAKTVIPVTTACAAAGLIIAGIMSTGLGGKLTSIVLGLTGGMFLPTLILVMFLCILLGMGMPVAAAYILTAMLAAPALMELGVSLLAAHLFIVYFSIFSAITPPVAVAAYAGAGIADANPNRVGIEAVKLGMVGFIVPFMFVMDPALLMDSSIGDILISTITAIIGVTTLAAGTIGWFITKVHPFGRILLIGSGLLSMYPDILYSAIGLVIIIVITVLQKRRKVAFSSNIPL